MDNSGNTIGPWFGQKPELGQKNIFEYPKRDDWPNKSAKILIT